MHLPEPIPPVVQDESFAGVTYHIRGELVPELQVEVGAQSVMFEHHVLLWKETQVNVELRKLPGAIKRKVAGLEFFVTHTVRRRPASPSRATPRASASRCTCARARGSTSASTSSSRRRTTSTTASNGSRACRTWCSAARGSSWTSSARPTATRSCGCTATATSSSCRSTTASSSTSRPELVALQGPEREARGDHDGPEVGHLRRRQASSRGTASRGPGGSRSRRCSSHRSRARAREARTRAPRPPAASQARSLAG